jgi:putative acetyltransferase
VISAQIRLEQPDDVVAIRETNEQAFGTTTEARLVDRLRNSTDCISLVATIGGRVIGHILFTPISLDPATTVRVAGLAPMAVRPEHQRAGVGSQLVRAGLEKCLERGYSAVVLVGHPHFYPRFGFVQGHTKGLVCEFPVPQEAFMVLELKVSALAGVTGLVRFQPEFAEG